MNYKTVKKLKRQLAELRQGVGNMKPRKLERFAIKLGRNKVNRGKEPTWESEILPKSRPITIPHHSIVKVGTAHNILDQFEGDIFQLEILFPEPPREGQHENN
jgi:hypothetical protein